MNNEIERVDIFVTTGYGARTKQPFVTLTVQAKEFSVQMPPEDAQALALNLLSAAEAALQDAFLVEFMNQQVGLEMDKVAVLLRDFRQWRERREGNQHEQGVE